MDKQYLIVELRKPEELDELHKEIDSLRQQIERLKRELRACENKYGYEVMLNGELVDLLRAHHIPFRELLDKAKRK